MKIYLLIIVSTLWVISLGSMYLAYRKQKQLVNNYKELYREASTEKKKWISMYLQLKRKKLL